jgi:hypothetical protein
VGIAGAVENVMSHQSKYNQRSRRLDKSAFRRKNSSLCMMAIDRIKCVAFLLALFGIKSCLDMKSLFEFEIISVPTWLLCRTMSSNTSVSAPSASRHQLLCLGSIRSVLLPIEERKEAQEIFFFLSDVHRSLKLSCVCSNKE